MMVRELKLWLMDTGNFIARSKEDIEEKLRCKNQNSLFFISSVIGNIRCSLQFYLIFLYYFSIYIYPSYLTLIYLFLKKQIM